jgi:hypothetical protein
MKKTFPGWSNRRRWRIVSNRATKKMMTVAEIALITLAILPIMFHGHWDTADQIFDIQL